RVAAARCAASMCAPRAEARRRRGFARAPPSSTLPLVATTGIGLRPRPASRIMKRWIARLHLRRYLVAGALMLAPLWVTWIVLEFIFTLLSGMGRPWVNAFTGVIAQVSPGTAELLHDSHLEGVLAALLMLVLLYVIGWATSRVLARQIIAQLEAVVARIPLVELIYGSTKKLVAALQMKPQGV